MLWLIHVVIMAFIVWLMAVFRQKAGESAQRMQARRTRPAINKKCQSDSVQKKLRTASKRAVEGAYDTSYTIFFGVAHTSPKQAMYAATRCFLLTMIVTFVLYLRIPIMMIRLGRGLCIPLSMIGSMFEWDDHLPNVNLWYFHHPDQQRVLMKQIRPLMKQSGFFKKLNPVFRWLLQFPALILFAFSEVVIGPFIDLNYCCLKTYSRFSLRNVLAKHLEWAFQGKVAPVGTQEFSDHIISARSNYDIKQKLAPMVLAYAEMPSWIFARKWKTFFGWSAAWCIACVAYANIANAGSGEEEQPVSPASLDIIFAAFTVVAIAIYLLTLFAPRGKA